ncbi:VanZ family protein [Halorientalis sp.]|uniref:VanZ family protein n=1 Tax=Halorientalis sp. TaxID=1931229 RepID=UPI0026110777|nr:VanZ family protein [Halorientalis sp.]
MQWPTERHTTGLLRTVPAICDAAAVLVASVADPPAGGLAPTGPLGLVGVDKWLHAVGYAVLAALLAYALWATTARQIATAVGITVTYGAGIEVVQAFHPLRAFGAGDLFANAVGAAVVGLTLWLETRRRARDRNSVTSATE